MRRKRMGPQTTTPANIARMETCPQCGGLTDRPYLDCSRCRELRRRMSPAQQKATRAVMPGLDGDELAARRLRDEDELTG